MEMDITWNQIKQLSPSLYTEIKKILKAESYKNISEDTILELINSSDIIIYLLKNFELYDEAKDKILEEFENILKKHITSQLSTNNIDVIKNYLKPHEKKFRNKKNKYHGLNILSELFNELDLTPDIDILMCIYDNIDFVKENVENIVKTNLKSIIDGTFTFSCQNEILISLIEIYCLKNDIQINLESETDEFQFHLDDDGYEENAETSDFNINYSDIDELDTYQIDLTKQILVDARKYPLLPQEELRELIKKAQNGSQFAKDKLILHNQRLVINMLQKYLRNRNEFLDLYQEGCIGLTKAIEKFDLSKKFYFSTYATWWVRQAITRYIADYSRTIRIPVHLNEKLSKLNKIINHYTLNLNKEPSIEELAKEMKCSESTILDLFKYSKDAVSYNTKVDDESESELVDFISSDINIERDFEHEHFYENVIEFFNSINLDERSKTVALHRLDIPGYEKLTLEQLGQKFNITRERIRQIEEKNKKRIFLSKNYKNFCALFPNSEEVEKIILEYREKYYREQEEKIINITDYSTKSLLSKIGAEKARMQEIVNLLSDENQLFIKSHYDADFNPITANWNIPHDNFEIVNILENIQRIIKENFIDSKNNPYVDLCILWNININELKIYKDKLVIPDQLYLSKLYDADFKLKKECTLFKNDYKRLNKLKKQITKMAIEPNYSPRKLTNLANIIGVTVEELDNLTDYVTVDIQRFLSKHYDENWDEKTTKTEEETEFLKSVIKLLRRIKKAVANKVLNPYCISQNIEQLTKLEQIITLGLVTQEHYDISAIAEFLKLDESYVINVIKEKLIETQKENKNLLENQFMLIRKKQESNNTEEVKQ